MAHLVQCHRLAQPVRGRLDDVEYLLAEGAHELLRVNGANAPDHAGREVLLDAVGRGRGRCAQEPRFELQAMGVVVGPLPGGHDPFAGGDRCCVPHHRDEITMPARLGAQDAESVLLIVVGDALDQAGEHLLIGSNLLCRHDPVARASC